MYVKNEEVKEINFLASAKYHNYTRQIDNKGVVANAKGRKIVKAGTVYRNSQGVAIGLVFNDVDVTEGPQPGAVMYEGWVLAARLPEKIADASEPKKYPVQADRKNTEDIAEKAILCYNPTFRNNV